jgi:hypothetical protein
MAGKIHLSHNIFVGSPANNMVSLPRDNDMVVEARNNTVVGANLIRVRSREEDIARLAREFPELARAPSDAVIEAADGMRGTSEAEGLSLFRDSRLGKWLQSQKGIDWANLAFNFWKALSE